MARLPIPGSDTGAWGSLLNEYLAVVHAADGTLKDGVVGTGQLQGGSVTSSKLADDSVTAAAIAPGSVTKADVGLGNADDTSDANKPISTATQTALNAKLSASNNLSDLASASTARTNLGLGSAATMTPTQLASDTAFTTVYPSRRVALARTIVAAAARQGSLTAISSITPTVTDSRNVTAPVTFTGIRIQPKEMPSGNLVDIANDPHFEYPSMAPGTFSTHSSGDMTRAVLLTGGASQAARWQFRVRFVLTGQRFGVYWRTPGSGGLAYRIHVDGVPLTSPDMIALSPAPAAAVRGVIEVDLGSVGTRLIEVDVNDLEFGGIYIEATSSITRPMLTQMTLVGIGDSHCGGANGVGRSDTWVRRAAWLLNLNWANQGIGGSGFLNSGGVAPDFRYRLSPDVASLNPEVVVFEGSWNDGAASSSAVGAEALFCYQQLRSLLPNSLLIAAGPWVTSHNLSATLDNHDAALRASAEQAGWDGYISFRDPANLKASTAAWVASTAYAVGDTRVHNGLVQKCVTAHTSTASFDQTRWRSTAVVTGTGRVGATTGDGSADVIVSNDAVHSTALGHTVKGGFIASEVRRIASEVASGATWAG